VSLANSSSDYGPEPSHQGASNADLSDLLASSHLPNPRAMINDRINRMGPEQYPPSPALLCNETPPYPRLTGTDY